MKMQQQDTCSICSQQPEDLLILQCHHHLCIDCASQVYNISSKSDTICCQICLTETALDRQTIKYLKSLLNSNNSSPHFPPKPTSKKQIENICIQHRQNCLYYCFDCETFKICSQCILTTKHLNHKVLTIKNALKSITKRLIQNNKIKETIVQRLNFKKANVESQKDALLHQLDEKKSSLKAIFDEIFKIINDKYIDLTNQLQNAWKRNIQILQGFITTIDHKVKKITQSIDYQKSIINNDKEIQILRYYGQSKQQDHTITNQIGQITNNNCLYLKNNQNITSVIKQIINGLEWEEDESSRDFSIIEKQKLVGSRYKQSGKSKMSQSFTNNHRKLELSRSINNATNIINKLQSRIKNQ